MYIILALDFALFVVSMVLFVVNRPGLLRAGFVLALIPLVVGVLGYYDQMSMLESNMGSVELDKQKWVLEASRYAASLAMKFGLYSSLFFCTLLGLRFYFSSIKK